MEKKVSEHLKDINLATVLQEVQSLKTALEVRTLKEQTIACVLGVEDVKVIEQMAKAIYEIWQAPTSKSITGGEGTLEGND